MKLIINKDRTTVAVGTWGTVNENDYEILDFEFPAELEEYNKRIVYYLDDERVWDTIVNNKAYITNAITTKGDVKAYVWCTKENTEREADTDFRTMLFDMHFYENDNADGIVPTPEQVDGFNTMLTEMNAKIDEADALEQTIGAAEAQRQEAEATRVSNENTRESNESTRESNEQTRQLQEAERERRTDEAIGNIEDKTAEYNANAEAKTNEFNQNATQKTNDFNSNYTQKVNDFNTNASSKESAFNSNASSKTSDFNSNAEAKTNAFNTNATNKTNAFNSNATEKTTAFDNNATEKTSEFNTNAESKTSAFNDNATQKTTNFDNNASEKTDEFNTNAQEKIDEYDEHIVEYQAQIDELQEEVEELSENMPWNTTEQATEISVDDAAKYSRNKLELFGNTSQDSTSGSQAIDYSEVINREVNFNDVTLLISTTNFNIKADTTYYIRWIFTDNTYVDASSTLDNIRFYNGTSIQKQFGGTNQVFTSQELDGITSIQVRATNTFASTYAGKTIKALVFSSDVNKITPDTYEPYTGGQPSPSPDFPQDIHVVTGNTTIEIESENKFNINQNYIVGQFKSDGTIDTNIQANINIAGNTMTVTLPNNNPSGWISNLVEFISKETHILSFNAERNTFKIIIAEYNQNQQYIKQTSLENSSSRSIQLQPDNNTKYIRFIFENITNNFSNNFSSIQFRKGTIVRDYEEYFDKKINIDFEDNVVTNVNNTDDILFKNTTTSKYYNSNLVINGWYILSRCIFKFFNGNEDWEKIVSSTEGTLLKAFFLHRNIPDIEIVNFNYEQKGYCNIGKLGVGSARSYTGFNKEGTAVGARALYVCYKKFENMSVNEFKEYLSENPISILCKRDNPVYIQLTAQDLTNSLNEIYEHLQLVKGTNNITVTAEDLAPYMQLSYMQDLKSKLDNLDSRLALLE